MLIGDVMKTNIVSVPSDTSLAEARRILEAHKIRRLPVIDHNCLVGIVTKDSLDKAGPSELTTFNVHELAYLLNRITVKEVMHRDVLTVPPDTTIEEAVALAQEKRVGSLIIVESGKVVGIATTNDIFVNVLNPLLGIGLSGARMVVVNCYTGQDIVRVISTINKLQVSLTNLFISEFREVGKHDLILHLDIPDASQVAKEIEKLGFTVVIRKR